jgi:type IV/VI secretion system ImpK/VasF family protein
MAPLALSRCAADFATFVQVLGSAGGAGFPDAAALRGQLLGLLEAFSKAAQDAGVTRDEIEEARFVLVAWADEVVLKSSSSGRDEWLREPLQMQLYRTARAGNEFYERLARLRPDQLAAREIYFLALALGFEGQYQGQEAERRALLERQYETLRAAGRLLETPRESQLSPAAYELEIELPRRERGFGIGFGVIGIGLVLAIVYGALWLVLRSVSGEVPLPRGL